MGLEAADIGDEIVDFLLREQKTAHTPMGFGEEVCQSVIGPANVMGDNRKRPGAASHPTAIYEMALGAPTVGDILARNRVTCRPHRATHDQQGATQDDYRRKPAMRTP